MRHRIVRDVAAVDVDDAVETGEVERLVVRQDLAQRLLDAVLVAIEAHRLLRQDEENLIVEKSVDGRVGRLLFRRGEEIPHARLGMVPGAIEREHPATQLRQPLEAHQLVAADAFLLEARATPRDPAAARSATSGSLPPRWQRWRPRQPAAAATALRGWRRAAASSASARRARGARTGPSVSSSIRVSATESQSSALVPARTRGRQPGRR